MELTFTTAAFVVLAPLMLLTAYFDLRQLRIPNWLTALTAAAFLPVGLAFLPLPEIGWRYLTGAAFLAAGFLIHMIGKMGGGDIKMLSALAVWIPRGDAMTVLMIFAGTLIVGLIGILAARKLAPVYAPWLSLQAGARYPMGVSMAATVVIWLYLAIWGG